MTPKTAENRRLLFAPPEYWQLTDEQRKDICNGCGTKGFCGYLVPDNLWGLDITEACNIHDYMYHIGQTIADKELADRVFLNNMIRLIDAGTRWNWLKRRRVREAKVYHYFVVEFGGPAFWADKNQPEEMGIPSLQAA